MQTGHPTADRLPRSVGRQGEIEKSFGGTMIDKSLLTPFDNTTAQSILTRSAKQTME
jgi:hypothetical protein